MREATKVTLLSASLIALIAFGVWVYLLTAPFTGVGVRAQKLEIVASLSFPIHAERMPLVEEELMRFAAKKNAKGGSFQVPVNGGQGLFIKIAMPGRTIVTAGNYVREDRLDVRVSSADPRDVWEPLAAEIGATLETVLR